MKKMFSTLDM